MSIPDYYIDAANVPLSPPGPLLIVDADEVLLLFAEGFERFLRARGLYLDLSSYRLHGNVKRIADEVAALDVEVTALLEEFRAALDDLEAVEHARETIDGLRGMMDIVVLSNVTPPQAPARRRNLDALGFTFPLLVNTGSKGEAVKRLAAGSGQPVFFVDDIPQHHASVAKRSPEVFRIHLVGDKRLKPLLPLCPDAHIRAEDWRDADAFIRERLHEHHGRSRG